MFLSSADKMKTCQNTQGWIICLVRVGATLASGFLLLVSCKLMNNIIYPSNTSQRNYFNYQEK